MNPLFTTEFIPAYAAPLTGQFRVQHSDFKVNEQMDIELSGQGEHLWLQVRKTGSNTDWVAGQLARCAGIKELEVGYAGLKDRHAVTTQWFSLQLAGKPDPDFSALPAEIEILQTQRHDKKLRTGALTANHFELVLRNVAGDLEQIKPIIEKIKIQGIPNYFGEQRFGNERNNLTKALAWFKGEFRPKQKHQMGLYISAARSWIFNHILQARIQQNNWYTRLAGDVLVLEDSHSWFVDDGSESLIQRLEQGDIHPSGALWGEGELPTQSLMRALELQQADGFPEFCAGLNKQRLKHDRRALRVMVKNLEYALLDQQTLQLNFTLPAGAYATVLLEQLGRFSSAVHV
ncbi:MAG: tRNA pseudouridine(13) synthase TruD [Thiofilum sp.]|uniref:tRNA pseudouridine(13) synthase TruD n=1 Tax=Thiofilum sp. TaxID=2212733 RepID=UPI0025E4FD1D|nr:tRNA pseudouridine(13) synthase TruD [Thiofilum sp.]MBK8452449.1 tRNA pseudouridine(13) synthase TruD [Thiofilum sp.]